MPFSVSAWVKIEGVVTATIDRNYGGKAVEVIYENGFGVMYNTQATNELRFWIVNNTSIGVQPARYATIDITYC